MFPCLWPCTVRGPIVSPFGTSCKHFTPSFHVLGLPFGASKGHTLQTSESCSAYLTHTAPATREQSHGMATVDIPDCCRSQPTLLYKYYYSFEGASDTESLTQVKRTSTVYSLNFMICQHKCQWNSTTCAGILRKDGGQIHLLRILSN